MEYFIPRVCAPIDAESNSESVLTGGLYHQLVVEGPSRVDTSSYDSGTAHSLTLPFTVSNSCSGKPLGELSMMKIKFLPYQSLTQLPQSCRQLFVHGVVRWSSNLAVVQECSCRA